MNDLKIYIYFLLSVLGVNTIAQNSPCTAVNGFCGAASITNGWTAAGSGIVDPTCSSAGTGAYSDQYWIKYVPPAGATQFSANFDQTTGGGSRPLSDPAFQVFRTTGTCGSNFTLVGCYNNDNGTGNNEQETIPVIAGNEYYIRVFNGGNPRNVTYSGGSANNEFTGCIKSEGDEPCTALPINSFPYTHTNSTSTASGYSNFMVGGCDGNLSGVTGNGNDVFYELTVNADSHYSLQLTGTNASDVLELAVLSAAACAGPWTCLTNGAWSGGLQTGEPAISGNFVVTNTTSDSPCKSVWFETAGTYYLKVDAGAGVSGSYTINVDQYVPAALNNGGDACANATGLSDGFTQNVVNNNCSYSAGSDDPDGALICAGTIENTTWMQFQSTGGGTPVDVTVSGVTCDEFGYSTGAGYYGGSGQFGIFTSSTGACGGTYTSADACQSLTTGDSYSTTLPNATPTTYFLVWDGNGGAECDFSITATNVIPLPADLLSFRLIKQENSNELLWEVASEQNLSHYIIESSPNGIDFDEIGIVEGTGNTSETVSYTYSDFDYHLPKSFYRIKMVDYDDKTEVSNVVATDRSSEIRNMEVSIFPNPSSGLTTLDLVTFSSGESTFRLVDLQGQLIFESFGIVEKGVNTYQFDWTNVAKGIYNLEVIQGTSRKIVKFIKL